MNNTDLLPVPKNFNITENFGELIIEYKWNRIIGVVVLVFALIWNGFMYYILTNMPPEMRFIIIFHAAIGVFLVYFAFCNLLNKTVITCDHTHLRIKTGPLPTFNNQLVNSTDIAQLYFTQKVTRGKNGPQISYHLNMLDHNNRSKKIMRHLPDPESARFLERKLEKFFKIENKAVAGQYDNAPS